MALWANRLQSGKIGPVERSSSGDTGSCSRSGIDGKFTPDKMNPLPHTHQAKTSRSFRFLNVKSGAVVTDAKGQFTGARSHIHVNIVGAAVSCNIVERLLNDPEEGQCDIVVQFCGNAGTGARNLDGVLLGEFPAESCNCNRQAKVFQLGRMELMG